MTISSQGTCNESEQEVIYRKVIRILKLKWVLHNSHIEEKVEMMKLIKELILLQKRVIENSPKHIGFELI